jgi:hypothetical protein
MKTVTKAAKTAKVVTATRPAKAAKRVRTIRRARTVRAGTKVSRIAVGRARIVPIRGLGKTQKKTLAAIQKFVKQNDGRMPTMKEIIQMGGFARLKDAYPRAFGVLTSLKQREILSWKKGDMSTLAMTPSSSSSLPGKVAGSPRAERFERNGKDGLLKVVRSEAIESAFTALMSKATGLEEQARKIREHVKQMRALVGTKVGA